MTISLTQLYDILSIKIGKEQAETLTTFIEQKIDKEIATNKEVMTSDFKSEFAALRVEMAKNHTEIAKDFSSMEKAIRGQMWAFIAMFVPIFITLFIFIITNKK